MNLFALIAVMPLPYFQVVGPADEAEQDQHGVAVLDDQRSTQTAGGKNIFRLRIGAAQQMGSCVVSKKVSVEYLTR
jgi:hypothetical protein